jgi:hypothetical protein
MQIYKLYLNAGKGEKKSVNTEVKIVKEEPQSVFKEESLSDNEEDVF